MSKQRKKQHQKGQQRIDAGLSLSVVIPFEATEGKLALCIESILKIRKPSEKDFEVVLAVKDKREADKLLDGSEQVAGLKRNNIIRVLEIQAEATKFAAVRTALGDTSREMILILDPDSLERSFNFDEIFSIPGKELDEHGIIAPVFREQVAGPDMKQSPMLLMHRTFAEYLLDLDPGSSINFQSQIFYFLSGMDIQPAIHPISQVNPFGDPARRKLKTRFSERIKHLRNWYFRIPLKELKTSPHKRLPFLDSPSYFRSLFVIAAILIAILLPVMSIESGQSGDDEKHYVHAGKVYSYFATGGKDRSALEDPKLKLNYYGQSLDLLTYIVNKTFRIEREYEARHFIIGISGVLAILFAGLTARRLAGYRAGFITMVLMFLAPRFLGHSMNNPMDTPFAFGYIFTLYHTFRFLDRLPEFSKKHAAWIMLGIAFTTSIRIGGLLLIPYVGMFAGLYVLFNPFAFKRFSKEWYRLVYRGLMFLSVIALGGYLISLIPWPYGFQKPFKNPFEALKMMSNISVAIRVLFDGDIIWSNRLPWQYISLNIFYTVPVVILAGFLINPILGPFYRKDIKPLFIFFLFFVVLFPLAYVIYKESNVYGGWRHMMFVFPAMAILSAISYDRLIRLAKAPAARIAVYAVLLVGIIHPTIHIIRNHPLQYVYFNELLSAGNAYGRFENDYYMNSLKQGTEWLAEEVLSKHQGDEPLVVASNGSISYYLRHLTEKARPIYTRYYDRAEFDWDYAVYFCNYIHPHQLRSGLWPPAGTVKTIDVNGIPVCAIVERESKADMLAINMIKRRDYERGIHALELVNQEYPTSEIVKLRLGEGYINLKQYDKVHAIVNECLELYPEYDKALNLRGLAYLETGDLNNAKTTFLAINRINYRFAPAYHNLGMLYLRTNPPDLPMSVNYFQQAIRANPRYKASYYALATIFRQQGMIPEAEQYETAVSKL